MALTISQQPSSISINNYVHNYLSNYDTNYKIQSNLYDTYSDFKYEFEIYTTDGRISKSKNPPYLTGGYGKYNANTVLKSLFDSDFQPTITNFTRCPNSILNYYVKCNEFSYDISSPATSTFQKAIIINANKKDFDYTEHKLYSGEEKLLTDWTSTRKVSVDEYGTLRALSGNLQAGYLVSQTSRMNNIQVIVTRSNGDKYWYLSASENPYYGNSSQNGLNTDNTVLQDLGDWLIDFPCLPGNFSSMKWIQTGYQLSSGSFVSTSIGVAGNIAPVGSTYQIRTYTVPYGDHGATSIAYNFEVVERCPQYDPIQLQWENDYGAFDFFTFNLVSAKSISNTKSTYRKVNDNENVYDRGETVFHVDIDTNYIANSDWLSKQTILDLEPLWTSKNVFAYIDGSWYPVVMLIENQVINTTRKGLRQYQIEFRLSNKLYK